MKLKQLITGGAFAATVLTLGSAQAEENYYNGIVFCKATIVGGADDSSVSVTLPFTTTGANGQQYTHWNLGKVAAGGVADSWHSEGGPGRFTAHNSGNVGAYVYLTSSRWNGGYMTDWYRTKDDDLKAQGGVSEEVLDITQEIFNTPLAYMLEPLSTLAAWRVNESAHGYCLAFTRDMDAKYPTWHMLNRECHAYSSDCYVWEEGSYTEGESLVHYIGAYMGYLAAGDYMPFDVKFWAPTLYFVDEGESLSVYFTFMVEAAPFPLWEHDRDVK